MQEMHQVWKSTMAIKHMKKILNMEIWHKEPKFTLKKLGSLHKVLYVKQKKNEKKCNKKKGKKNR